MCGIAGFYDAGRATPTDELKRMVVNMAQAIRHRGPDDAGDWVDAHAGVALGFRRLAIIDLSTAGAQPMISHDGRWVIVFNGEIYNHRQIRDDLEGRHGEWERAKRNGPLATISEKEKIASVTWRGHSDTETMLEAISTWGLEAAVKRFNGMFAFALWDQQKRVLHLVRDRLGKKPMYYGWMGQTFLFGSELKSLRAHCAFRGEVNRDALAVYLRHSYIPSPYSIYQEIFKLQPATILSLDCSGDSAKLSEPVLSQYWSAKTVAEQGTANPHAGSPKEITTELDKLLRDSVALRMEADVPLGAFLSGGIDSSLIVALMQAQSSRPVRLF